MGKQKGILIVVSGFSGAGKGTVMKRLLAEYADSYVLSISATTRKPREGETEGIEYFFKTREEFEKMIAKGELIEYAKYVENYYGTPREYVEQMLFQGKDVILEIELQGALKIKKLFPETLLLFIVSPSAEELERRLAGRGTETYEVICSRMHRAAEEARYLSQYDYIVENDDLEKCVQAVHGIIQAEKRRSVRSGDLIHKVQTELNAWKGEKE